MSWWLAVCGCLSKSCLPKEDGPLPAGEGERGAGASPTPQRASSSEGTSVRARRPQEATLAVRLEDGAGSSSSAAHGSDGFTAGAAEHLKSTVRGAVANQAQELMGIAGADQNLPPAASPAARASAGPSQDAAVAPAPSRLPQDPLQPAPVLPSVTPSDAVATLLDLDLGQRAHGSSSQSRVRRTMQLSVPAVDEGVPFAFNMPPAGMVDAAALAVATVARVSPMPTRSPVVHQAPTTTSTSAISTVSGNRRPSWSAAVAAAAAATASRQPGALMVQTAFPADLPAQAILDDSSTISISSSEDNDDGLPSPTGSGTVAASAAEAFRAAAAAVAADGPLAPGVHAGIGSPRFLPRANAQQAAFIRGTLAALKQATLAGFDNLGEAEVLPGLPRVWPGQSLSHNRASGSNMAPSIGSGGGATPPSAVGWQGPSSTSSTQISLGPHPRLACHASVHEANLAAIFGGLSRSGGGAGGGISSSGVSDISAAAAALTPPASDKVASAPGSGALGDRIAAGRAAVVGGETMKQWVAVPRQADEAQSTGVLPAFLPGPLTTSLGEPPDSDNQQQQLRLPPRPLPNLPGLPPLPPVRPRFPQQQVVQQILQQQQMLEQQQVLLHYRLQYEYQRQQQMQGQRQQQQPGIDAGALAASGSLSPPLLVRTLQPHSQSPGALTTTTCAPDSPGPPAVGPPQYADVLQQIFARATAVQQQMLQQQQQQVERQQVEGHEARGVTFATGPAAAELPKAVDVGLSLTGRRLPAPPALVPVPEREASFESPFASQAAGLLFHSAAADGAAAAASGAQRVAGSGLRPQQGGQRVAVVGDAAGEGDTRAAAARTGAAGDDADAIRTDNAVVPTAERADMPSAESAVRHESGGNAGEGEDERSNSAEMSKHSSSARISKRSTTEATLAASDSGWGSAGGVSAEGAVSAAVPVAAALAHDGDGGDPIDAAAPLPGAATLPAAATAPEAEVAAFAQQLHMEQREVLAQLVREKWSPFSFPLLTATATQSAAIVAPVPHIPDGVAGLPCGSPDGPGSCGDARAVAAAAAGAGLLRMPSQSPGWPAAAYESPSSSSTSGLGACFAGAGLSWPGTAAAAAAAARGGNRGGDGVARRDSAGDSGDPSKSSCTTGRSHAAYPGTASSAPRISLGSTINSSPSHTHSFLGASMGMMYDSSCPESRTGREAATVAQVTPLLAAFQPSPARYGTNVRAVTLEGAGDDPAAAAAKASAADASGRGPVTAPASVTGRTTTSAAPTSAPEQPNSTRTAPAGPWAPAEGAVAAPGQQLSRPGLPRQLTAAAAMGPRAVSNYPSVTQPEAPPAARSHDDSIASAASIYASAPPATTTTTTTAAAAAGDEGATSADPRDGRYLVERDPSARFDLEMSLTISGRRPLSTSPSVDTTAALAPGPTPAPDAPVLVAATTAVVARQSPPPPAARTLAAPAGATRPAVSGTASHEAAPLELSTTQTIAVSAVAASGSAPDAAAASVSVSSSSAAAAVAPAAAAAGGGDEASGAGLQYVRTLVGRKWSPFFDLEASLSGPDRPGPGYSPAADGAVAAPAPAPDLSVLAVAVAAASASPSLPGDHTPSAAPVAATPQGFPIFPGRAEETARGPAPLQSRVPTVPPDPPEMRSVAAGEASSCATSLPHPPQQPAPAAAAVVAGAAPAAAVGGGSVASAGADMAFVRSLVGRKWSPFFDLEASPTTSATAAAAAHPGLALSGLAEDTSGLANRESIQYPRPSPPSQQEQEPRRPQSASEVSAVNTPDAILLPASAAAPPPLPEVAAAVARALGSACSGTPPAGVMTEFGAAFAMGELWEAAPPPSPPPLPQAMPQPAPAAAAGDVRAASAEPALIGADLAHLPSLVGRKWFAELASGVGTSAAGRALSSAAFTGGAVCGPSPSLAVEMRPAAVAAAVGPSSPPVAALSPEVDMALVRSLVGRKWSPFFDLEASLSAATSAVAVPASPGITRGSAEAQSQAGHAAATAAEHRAVAAGAVDYEGDGSVAPATPEAE